MCVCVCVWQAALSHFESTYEDEREKEWVKSDFEMLVTK
jgi:hypothetical protein